MSFSNGMFRDMAGLERDYPFTGYPVQSYYIKSRGKCPDLFRITQLPNIRYNREISNLGETVRTLTGYAVNEFSGYPLQP